MCTDPSLSGLSHWHWGNQINSLAPGIFKFNFRWVIFKLNLLNGGWGISYEIALRWMPLNLTDDKSTLVQVMAWCRQATSHYLSQCWPRYMSPNGITRPQCVNIIGHFTDNIFQYIFLAENLCIFIKISPKFVLTLSNDFMAWCHQYLMHQVFCVTFMWMQFHKKCSWT